MNKKLLLTLAVIPFVCSCTTSKTYINANYQKAFESYYPAELNRICGEGNWTLFGITQNYLSSRDIEGDKYEYWDNKVLYNYGGSVESRFYVAAYCEKTNYLQVSSYYVK